MKKQTAIITIITALFFVVIGVNSGFAKKGGGGEKSTGTQTQPSSDSMPGHNFGTGEEFGDHVSDHAVEGKLGKEHNPGNHQGFSGNVNSK